MDIMAKKAEFNAILEKREKQDFADFLDSPAVKLLLTMLPPAEPKELTSTILLAAFKAGMQSGTSACAEDMIGMLKTALGKKP